ncbi:MAG: protein kinase [Pirellulaceae bacterium]
MNQQLCDPNRLSSFVRGELSDEAERELTAHLDECESCGRALEHQVAEESAWREASVFLSERIAQDHDADFSITQSRDAQIEHVVSQLSPTDDPESLGRIGGYEVTGVVGSGGMGVVLKAREHALDRVVAVKVMAPHLAASGSARQRFAREARAAAAVLHPNVIAIHGVSNEQALPYLVMPYVAGESLQKRIDTEGPLPLVDILRIGAQVAAGLAAAHEQGLVHRDIKPGNILMEQGVERVTITDFGLARAVDDASMTRSGVIAGTPQYMSPEQARGEPIDARSDLFSLGSLLYAMCTGHSPFRAETSFGVLHRITQDSPRPITEVNPDIPLWLEGIVMKLLSKHAEDRFQSSTEVAELLEGCLSHTQHPTTTPLLAPVLELATQPSKHRWWLKFVAASVVLWILLFAGVLIVLELGKGTLRIESEADSVPIRIVQGADVVKELTVSKSGKSVRIAAGIYEIEIGGQFDGLLVDDGSVTLQRGGNEVVRVVKAASVTGALGDWPYGRLLKDLQQIKPPGGVPVVPSGAPIRVAMGDELTRRLEAAPEVELDKWVDELERVTGDELDGELARQACRTYIVNRMSVLFDKGDWNPKTASRLFKQLQSLNPSEVEAWQNAFESLMKETIGQNDREVFDGGPSYAVPLVLIAVESLLDNEPKDLSSGANDLSLASGLSAAPVVRKSAGKYRKRLSRLSKQDIAAWRSKVDRFGGTKLDAAMNIILLDDYFVDEAFQDGDFAATLFGTNPLPLATAIAKFNSLHQWENQTPLTEDEVVACISWVLHHEEPPESKFRLGLRLLTEQRQLPQGWGISALESSPTIGSDVASQWTINLESVSEDRVIPIRQWAVSPPEALLEPTEKPADESGMPLQAAINAFNASRHTINGIRQPPLTLKEVLAAIAIWKSKRNDAGVDDATFENFQRISRTHYLPADTRFQMIPRFETSSGDYSIWSVSIVMPQVSKPEWTYAFSIRRQFIALNADLASQIHWGKPAENGLQAGFRLIPAQEVYRVGQVVDTEFFYRSIYGQAPVSLPNAFTHKKAHLRRSRTNDELEVIEDQQEKIVGGWISSGVTEEPIARRGRRIEFTDDPKADFKTNVGTKLIVSPTDGNLSLSFTVANPADRAEGESMETGEVHFRVIADELLPANREAARGTDATALPGQVESSDGNATDIVTKKSTAPQTRLEFEAHPQDVIALQIGPTKHNKSLEWTSVSTEMGRFSATVTDEKVRLEDGSWEPGFTFTTQDADGRTSTSYIAMAEGGPLPIGRFYLYRYKPNTLLDLKASVKVGEIKYPDGTSAPVSVTARAANDTMVALPVRVGSTGDTEEQSVNQSSVSPRRKTVRNLTRIAHALQRYHELHGHFPSATILGKDGKGGPPHSWRVELLPLLGHGGLYDRYNFKASWDSQRNLSVLAKMPDVYRSPLDQGNSTNTSYFGVVSDDISTRAAQLQEMREQREAASGVGILKDEPEYEQYTPEATVFWKQRGASFIDMLDGTSNCIAVIEAKQDVPWTKPEDIEYSADQPLPKFGGWFEQGVHAAFADGTVKFLANDNDEQTIRNLLTISDGQPVEPLLVRRLRIHGAVAVSEDEPEVAAGPEVYQVPDGPLLRILPGQQSIITETDILEVAATTNPNNPNGGDLVAMTLTDEAGKRFLKTTTKLSEPGTKGYMVIMFDRKVLSVPRVHGPISSKLTITGDVDAKTLAEQIQAAIDEVKAVELTPVANVQEDDVARVDEVLTEPGSYVTVPLKVEWHPEAAMKRHLGKRHLTVLADGNMQDERNANAVSRTLRSLFHDCRLESFELTTRDEADYWNARIFVPLKAEYSVGALWYKDPIRTLRIGDRHTPVPAETLAQDEPQVKLDEELKNGFQLRLDDSSEGEPGLSFERESEQRHSTENGYDEADAPADASKPKTSRFESRSTGPYGFLTAKEPVSLDDAVAAFNGLAGQNEIGKKQRELTADEVIASLRNWIDQNKGNAATRKELEEIIDTKTLRAGHQFSFTSRYISEGHVFDVWEIGFGDEDSVPWLKIRDIMLASRQKTQREQELWARIRTEMAKSFDHVRLGGLGASPERSPTESNRLGQLLEQAYQPPADVPGTRSSAVEAALHKYRPVRATRRAQVEERVHQLLQQPTLKSINKLPLVDVIKQFADHHEVKIIVDPLWLEDETPDLNQPVTADLGDLTLGAASDFILNPFGMSYIVRDEEIQITSLQRAARYQYERAYALPPLLKGEEEQVIDALTTKITPDKWWLSGGEYAASANEGWLTISANRKVHEAATVLLKELQQAPKPQSTPEQSTSGQSPDSEQKNSEKSPKQTDN